MARKMRFVSVRVCALSYCIRKLAKRSFLGNLELFSAHFKLCLVILITHSKKVTCHLTLVFVPTSALWKPWRILKCSFRQVLFAVAPQELCPRCWKSWRWWWGGKPAFFPNSGSSGVAAVVQWLVVTAAVVVVVGNLGTERGAGRLFKGWLFTLLVSWGLRSSVQQNSPSN